MRQQEARRNDASQRRQCETPGMQAAVIAHLERRLNRARLGPTRKSEEKFNIFKIRLGGGW
jgi:hypothetical protein